MTMPIRNKRVIALAVVSVLAVVALVVLALTAPKPDTQPTQTSTQVPAGSYAVVFDNESGQITQVIDGPDDVVIDAEYQLFSSNDIERNGVPHDTVYGTISIDGASYEVRSNFDGIISREDARTYYNEVVKSGGRIFLGDDDTQSLERYVTSYAFNLIDNAFDQGQLPEPSYVFDGLPTIAYDPEAAANYAQYNAEKLAWEQANPGPHTPSSDVNLGYNFECATQQVVADNWSDASSQFTTLLRTDLFSFGELEPSQVVLRTAEPCGYIDGDGEVVSTTDENAGPAVAVCSSEEECRPKE